MKTGSTISAHFLFSKKFATTKTFSAENSNSGFHGARTQFFKRGFDLLAQHFGRTRFNSQKRALDFARSGRQSRLRRERRARRRFSNPLHAAPPPLSDRRWSKDGQFFPQPIFKN